MPPERKTTSYGVTSAVKTRQSSITMSQYPMNLDVAGLITPLASSCIDATVSRTSSTQTDCRLAPASERRGGGASNFALASSLLLRRPPKKVFCCSSSSRSFA